MRLSGVAAIMAACACGSLLANMAVSTAPGAMQFTVILRGASSRASPLANVSTPPLETA